MAVSSIILPVTETSKSLVTLVPRSSGLYRFLSGNHVEQTRDTCGKHVWFGCLNHECHGHHLADGQLDLSGEKARGYDYIRHAKMSCGKLGCRTCYESASSRLALRVEHRIKQYNGAPRHFVVSPPQSEWIDVDFEIYEVVKKLKRKALKIAVKTGIVGGCAILHHLRRVGESYRHDDTETYASADKDDPAKWYLSPHVHIVGFGYTSKNLVLKTYHETGYVVKNLGVRQSVRATVLYQLSHAYIPEKGHALTWFGEMSYNSKMFKAVPFPKEKPECPDCGLKLKPLKFISREAEAIVSSMNLEIGDYRLSHGYFVYAPENNRFSGGFG